jgi:DNA-binding transcriptional LysR family regulator
MNIRTLDLNLLRVFAAINLERNISAAARRENLSQPAISNALARLRRSLNDPLFVKGAGGMEPTALAKQLVQPVNEALTILKNCLEMPDDFDPQHSTRSFKLLMSDAGESSILPALMRSIACLNTRVGFEVARLPHDQYAEALQTGTADLAIGNLPFLKKGFERHHLFEDPYCVIMRKGHPLLDRTLTQAVFASSEHVSVATGNADTMVDSYLSKHRMRRSIKLKVSHYHVAVDVVAASDLLATVPRIIASAATGVCMLPLPMKVQSAAVQMVWHSMHIDPANQWLRGIVAGLDLGAAAAVAA